MRTPQYMFECVCVCVYMYKWVCVTIWGAIGNLYKYAHTLYYMVCWCDFQSMNTTRTCVVNVKRLIERPAPTGRVTRYVFGFRVEHTWGSCVLCVLCTVAGWHWCGRDGGAHLSDKKQMPSTSQSTMPIYIHTLQSTKRTETCSQKHMLALNRQPGQEELCSFIRKHIWLCVYVCIKPLEMCTDQKGLVRSALHN